MKENHDKNLFNELTKMYFEETGHCLPDPKRYDAGTEIYSEGNVPKGTYYVQKGIVKICYNNHENPVVVCLVKAHEFMGYVSLIKQREHNTTAIAVEPCDVSLIPTDFFLTAIKKNIKFAHIALDILCGRLEDSSKILTELLTKSVQERLATLLLMLDHSPTDGKVSIMKKEIASILNIKAETLSRNLFQLQKQGIISLHSKTNGIDILSHEKLLNLTQVTD